MSGSQLSQLKNIPNLLSSLRLALGPVLLHIAWRGDHKGFLVVLILAFLLDLVDGPIARLTGQVTELGPKIDSWADFSIYLALPIGAWWLWPEIIIRESGFVALTIASIIIPTVVGFIKFRQSTSYHTWLTKFAVVCMAPSVIILFMEGPAWPFQVSSVICVIAGIEGILITLISKNRTSDAKTLFHVLYSRHQH